MTLLSGDISFVRIFLGRGRQTTVGSRERQFSAFSLAISSETLEIRPTLLYSDTQTVVGFSVTPKFVTLTLSDLEWLFRVNFFCQFV